MKRAKLPVGIYWVKDIRAKALIDAKRAKYDVEILNDAAAHTNVLTTQIYFKQRDISVSKVRRRVPKSA